MKLDNHSHLLDEQILSAVIDENDLPKDVLLHLLDCPFCKGEVTQLREDLHDFGRIAAQAVPPFSRSVFLPPATTAAISRNIGWLPFYGAAAMSALVVFFFFMGLQPMTSSKFTALQSQESLLEDESLMEEISDMVEYPLSEDMYNITGENGGSLDEDFLQFVVPEIQAEFQSL